MPPFATEQLRKLFIGGLNLDTTEESLKAYFSRWGETVDVVVMRYPDTRKSRGFGFVTYENVESVDAVLNAKPHVLDGKDIEPKRAVAREENSRSVKEEPEKCQKIFVGGLASATTEDDIRNCFTKFCDEAGDGKVEDVMIMRDRENNDRLRGFCFVTFDSPEIVDKICSVKYFEIRTKTVEVRRAQSRMAMMKKEDKDYGYNRRRMDDRRRDMNDSYQGSGRNMRGNFFGGSGFNPMAMQAAMSGGNGMPLMGGYGGGNSGGSRGGSGGFGGGFNMNPMALAGMMNMLASSMGMSMGMNPMQGGGGGMGSGGMGSGGMSSGSMVGSGGMQGNMSNMGMNAMGGGSSDSHNRGGGDTSYRNDVNDSFRAGSSNNSGYKSNSYPSENVSTNNPASTDGAGVYAAQNPSMYNEQAASNMGDMSGYANAMSAMFGAAGVNPANVQAALYSAYGGGGGNQLGSYDQSSSVYGPARSTSTGKAAGTNRSYKPY